MRFVNEEAKTIGKFLALLMALFIVAGCGDSTAKLAEDIKALDAISNEMKDNWNTSLQEIMNSSPNDEPEEWKTAKPKAEKLVGQDNAYIEKLKTIKVSEKAKTYLDLTNKFFVATKNFDELLLKGVSNPDLLYDEGEFQKQFYAAKNECVKTEFDRMVLKGQLLKEPPIFRIKANGVNVLGETKDNVEVYGKYASNVGVAVTSIETLDKISTNNPYIKPAIPMGKFVIVGLIVKNEQKDAITVDNASFKLKDAQGNIFSHSGEARIAMRHTSGDKKGFLTKLNPTMSVSFKVPFDIPKDANIEDYKLVGKGGFTGDKLELPLEVTRTGY